MTYIPLAECEHGWLYHIRARNFWLGIYNEPTKEFIGIRTKFGSHYTFGEDHWDTGAPHGTVKPIKKLEKAPFETFTTDSREQLALNIFAWLDSKRNDYPRHAYPHEAPEHG
jgi:hypothetical protein